MKKMNCIGHETLKKNKCCSRRKSRAENDEVEESYRLLDIGVFTLYDSANILSQNDPKMSLNQILKMKK